MEREGTAGLQANMQLERGEVDPNGSFVFHDHALVPVKKSDGSNRQPRRLRIPYQNGLTSFRLTSFRMGWVRSRRACTRREDDAVRKGIQSTVAGAHRPIANVEKRDHGKRANRGLGRGTGSPSSGRRLVGRFKDGYLFMNV